MNRHFKVDEWSIVEEEFDPAYQRAAESIFSLGNGHMGQRANFEESYSGDSLQGSYIAGIYYPDKTKVGWWKNGYPEYFAKVLNSVNWIGINIQVNGEQLDLARCDVKDFTRTLNMREGYLQRSFTARLKNGSEIAVKTRRFLSMVRPEAGAIEYSVRSLNVNGTITFTPYLDGDVQNEDSNYDEKFWSGVAQQELPDGGSVTMRTKKLDFHVCAGMHCNFQKNGKQVDYASRPRVAPKFVSQAYEVPVTRNDEVTLRKYAIVASSLNHERKRLHLHVLEQIGEISRRGFEALFSEHARHWKKKWEMSDIRIKGDEAAQQGIRFNIFQLNQTYTGEDERLNIGPKGFTGEKYGGSTYWDTEGYCLPFYLCTSDQKVARNLLLYRYRHLPRAIENARKLGFDGGAALYPMVTMNGEECHNEWEITFEEIHRNGAIAYAIYNYIRHTGDVEYLSEAGLEVLIGISRFWSRRFDFSDHRQKYVMLGVTGPNEYENNVNNNWYTSYIACWTMRYTLQCLKQVAEDYPSRYEEITDKAHFEDSETRQWLDILDKVYLPEDEERGIFLQQDGYLDKPQRMAADLDEAERPINQHWSWDRILRSCFIKQGDVVQGLYFFEDHFSEDTIRRNFDFYEPRTVHESSLSPCIHSILASRLEYRDKAYQLYVRTARLDLDDYNKEVHQGLHITSMAGTWMSIVEGFAGKRVKDGWLYFSPTLPEQWESYEFKIVFQNRILNVEVAREQLKIECEEGPELDLYIYDQLYHIAGDEPLVIPAEVLSL